MMGTPYALGIIYSVPTGPCTITQAQECVHSLDMFVYQSVCIGYVLSPVRAKDESSDAVT